MKTQAFPFAFFEDKIVKIENAKVSIMTNALQYGTGFFGGIRGYYNAEEKYISVFRLEDHYKRFFSSSRILGCEFPYTVEELTKQTIELIKKNNPQTDAYLRPFGYVGHTDLGPNLANTTLSFALYMIPLGEYLPVSKGLSVMVSSWRRISDNTIPSRAKISGGYVNSALARKEATENDYDEAILLGDNEHVSEGSAENFFMVRDGILITPSTSEGILEGITRRSIIQIAKDLNIPVESRSIERSELYIADEAFFSGTGCQVAWIGQIDKRKIGNGKRGPITEILQEKFFKIVRGKDKDYQDWCTKITMK
ncbi:MAG TPA: branched-chain amino acid transaminase [Candidatus Saccharimonadales bacterium]|nr:branched-chain amino acid transaminase [Candidatus Saccharimonadales bacterium]